MGLDPHHFIFSFTFYFLFILCGGLSWLPVSFLLDVKCTLSYRIGVSLSRLQRSQNMIASFLTRPPSNRSHWSKIPVETLRRCSSAECPFWRSSANTKINLTYEAVNWLHLLTTRVKARKWTRTSEALNRHPHIGMQPFLNSSKLLAISRSRKNFIISQNGSRIMLTNTPRNR